MNTKTTPFRTVLATPSHAANLKLRGSDLHEVNIQAPGQDPSDVVRGLLSQSEGAWAALDGEDVIAMGGYSVHTGARRLWLFASESIQDHGEQFRSFIKRGVGDLLRENPGHLVGNHVSRTNETNRAFLLSLGAVIVGTPGRADCDFYFFPHSCIDDWDLEDDQ